MEREQLDRLLAEYATGGLNEEEKKALFAAALTDQGLFDQLMEEDALREMIETPGARNRLIDSLQEEEVPAAAQMGARMLEMPAPAAPASASAPAPAAKPAAPSQAPVRRPAPPVWLAWAAGIGVVFVSAAATYMLFDAPDLSKLARNDAPRETKPFVPPPSAVAQPVKDKAVVVDAPPKILADNRPSTVVMPPASAIPLPSAPPPPVSEPAAAPALRNPVPAAPAPVVVPAAPPEAIPAKDTRTADKLTVARGERDAAQTEFRAVPQQQTTNSSSIALARRQSAPGAIGAGAGAGAGALARESNLEEKAKKEAPQPAVWRRSADGVWIRVPAGEPVDRSERIAVRYTPQRTGVVALFDRRGQRLVQKDGRAGEEMELIVPVSALARETTVTLTLAETGAPMGLIGGVASKPAAGIRIILRLR